MDNKTYKKRMHNLEQEIFIDRMNNLDISLIILLFMVFVTIGFVLIIKTFI